MTITNRKIIRNRWIKLALRHPVCFMIIKDLNGYVLMPTNKIHVVPKCLNDSTPRWDYDGCHVGYRVNLKTVFKLMHNGVQKGTM